MRNSPNLNTGTSGEVPSPDKVAFDMSGAPEFNSTGAKAAGRSERSTGERTQRLLELAGVAEIRKDEEKFEEAISELDRDSAYKWLSHINQMLRGVSKSERGLARNVSVAEHVAPSRPAQGKMLANTAEAMKDIKDNRYRAALAYFTVNNLHLFADGNGRTSRTVFEIFDNPDFNINDESFVHKTKSQHESGSHGIFERNKGIASTYEALHIARRSVAADLVKSDKIDRRAIEKMGHLEIIFGDTPDIFLTEDAEQNLTAAEKKSVNRAFMDGDFAVLTLYRMLRVKGTDNEVIEDSTVKRGDDEWIAFEVEKSDLDTGKPNEKAEKTFSSWTADDYRSFVKATEQLKVQTQNRLIDFFRSPDNYQMSDGTAVADFLSRKG